MQKLIVLFSVVLCVWGAASDEETAELRMTDAEWMKLTVADIGSFHAKQIHNKFVQCQGKLSQCTSQDNKLIKELTKAKMSLVNCQQGIPAVPLYSDDEVEEEELQPVNGDLDNVRDDMKNKYFQLLQDCLPVKAKCEEQTSEMTKELAKLNEALQTCKSGPTK